MKVGVTGGTGFMGWHLGRRLVREGHDAVLLGRSTPGTEGRVEGADYVSASVADSDALEEAFRGCDAVAHLAGINLERGRQTYEAVHVEGTRNAVGTAREAGADRILLTSFLRARPDCGSSYHESKWRAEEIVRDSGLEYTVLKPGITYGAGDHLVSHVSRALRTFPVFPLVGFRETLLRPLAVEDLVDIMTPVLVEDRLSGVTAGVVGPEELTLQAAVERIGKAVGREPRFVRLPLRLHYLAAWLGERVMETPLVSVAQVRILSEDVVTPAPPEECESLPADLEPGRDFGVERIRDGLPDEGRFGLRDLRL